MDSVALLQAINTLRKSKGFLSNAFLTRPQIEDILSKRQAAVLTGNGLVLLFINEIDYYRVYFYAQNELALGQIKELLPRTEKPIIADIVGKDPQAQTLATLLTNVGFEQYSTFVRMTCDSPPDMDTVDYSEVEIATHEDVDEILKLLYLEFDPLFAHIPRHEEIAAAIEKKKITVVRRENQLAGLTFFEETSANSICWRYLVVNPNYRGQGIGNMLIANMFSKNPAMKYMLWVGTYNSAINLHKRLNFIEDSVIDYILRYRGV